MAGSPSSDRFVGAVLCGGASKRMGRDKATLLVDGVPMAARVARAVEAAGATRVVLVGGDARALAVVGREVVPDDQPGDGPLPATITALRHSVVATPDAEIVFVASCDLLMPDPASIRATVEALVAHPGAVGAVPVVEGHRQWTHAAWRTRVLPGLEAASSKGTTSLRRAAADLLVYEVNGLDGTGLADADYPHDLPGNAAGGRGAGSVDRDVERS